MNLALNHAKNIAEHYKRKGETALIEIVTYGPGLHMLRADTSPVKDRIGPMALENPDLKFIACGNTQANQSKAEGKEVPLIGEATVMPSGAVRLMELQASRLRLHQTVGGPRTATCRAPPRGRRVPPRNP